MKRSDKLTEGLAIGIIRIHEKESRPSKMLEEIIFIPVSMKPPCESLIVEEMHACNQGSLLYHTPICFYGSMFVQINTEHPGSDHGI